MDWEKIKTMDLDERAERSRTLFRTGYNCTQAVVMSYADVLDTDVQTLLAVSLPFGGGLSRLREVCGAVSGMALLTGLMAPPPDPADRTGKAAAYERVQNVAERFRMQHGAIVCRELLGIAVRKEEPMPEARTEAYYRKRPCIELIASAARIVGACLKEQAAGHL